MIDINGTRVECKSRKQTVIALSSAESEYVALSECTKQLSWLRKLFWEFVHKQPWKRENSFLGTEIRIDSTSATSLAKSEQMSVKSKHIDMKVHQIKEL